VGRSRELTGVVAPQVGEGVLPIHACVMGTILWTVIRDIKTVSIWGGLPERHMASAVGPGRSTRAIAVSHTSSKVLCVPDRRSLDGAAAGSPRNGGRGRPLSCTAEVEPFGDYADAVDRIAARAPARYSLGLIW
jgi:hypothetical protein